MKIISDKWLHTLIAGTGPAIDLSYIGKSLQLQLRFEIVYQESLLSSNWVAHLPM